MDYSSGGAFSECQTGRMHYCLNGNYGTASDFVIQDHCVYDASNITIFNGENILWNGGKHIKGDLTIEGGATLTIECEVSMPVGATIFVESGGTLILNDGGTVTNICVPNTGPDFHVDIGPNSFMIVDNGSILTVEPNAVLEIHQDAELIVRNGGQLIIEDGAALSVHDRGLVKIEATSDLLLKNQTAGKGLTIGSTNFPAQTAELRISGSISTADNIDLTNNGDGFISFYDNGSFNAGLNSHIKLTGQDLDHTVLIFSNAVWSSAVFDVEINDGRTFVVSGSNVSIANGSQFRLNENSPFIVLGGSTLIIEDGGALSVSDDGLVQIEAGAELILQNQTAGKGLELGSSGTPQTAELRIEGTFTTTDNTSLTFFGDGFILLSW